MGDLLTNHKSEIALGGNVRPAAESRSTGLQFPVRMKWLTRLDGPAEAEIGVKSLSYEMPMRRPAVCGFQGSNAVCGGLPAIAT